MKRFDNFIDKLNFRLLIKIYFTIAVLLIVICGSVIAYSMRDKIYMAMDYKKVSSTFRKEGVNENLKLQLNKLASDSKDIINSFVVDKDNNIVFKVNNNITGNNGKFILAPYEVNKKYLKDNINSNIIYKVSKEEEIILNKDYINSHKKIENDIENEFFYEKNIRNNEIYLLNYVGDKTTGNKVFIIRKATPIPYAERLLEASGGIILIIFAVYWIGLALWVYKDANRKQINAPLWGLLVLVTNLAGLIIYTILKQNSKICHSCGLMQSKDNIFCSNCGVKINNNCSSCGNIVNPRDNYCNKCGNKL